MLQDPRTDPRSNYSATTNPGVSDDRNAGWGIGSHWLNLMSTELFVCFDNSPGAAVWKNIGSGGGGSEVHVDTRDPLNTDDGPAGFSVGDLWLNSVTERLFQCTSSATGNAVWWPITTLAIQALYVGKHGSDLYDGRSPARAKLTLGAAITAAGTPASEAAAVLINVIDDGEYAESVTAKNYVNIDAPRASIRGKLILTGVTAKCSIKVRRIVNDTLTSFDAGSGGGTTYIDVEEIDHSSSSGVGIIGPGSTVYLSAKRVYHNPGDGIICQGFGGNYAELHLNVDEWDMGAAGGGTSGVQASMQGRVFGHIGYMHGGDVGLSVANFTVGVPEMYVHVDKLDVPVPVNGIDANCKLRLIVGEMIGTPSIANGCDVRITHARRNNWVATIDPSAGDDSTDGYEIGSWWLNLSTTELYICIDDSAAAAVWKQVAVGSGGGVVAKTANPTINDDQTQGYDPGSLWVNVVNQTLWACISAATGAALWRNTTDLAHRYPYLVGPIGLAPYQTVQAAITAAPVNSDVWILPGTYIENITLKNKVRLRALIPTAANMLTFGAFANNVVINGYLALTGAAMLDEVWIEGLRINAPVGTPAISITAGASTIQLVVLRNCNLESNDALAFQYSGGLGVVLSAVDSSMSRAYTSVPGPALRVANTWDNFFVYGCQISTSSSTPGGATAVEITGPGDFTAQSLNQQLNTGIFGRIHVTAAASGVDLILRDVRMYDYHAENVTVDGTLSSGSYFYETRKDSAQDITIGGANASQFKERPNRSLSGDLRIFDGNRWQYAQLAAQQADYLVGPAGKAKYQTVQAAITQAVADGAGPSNIKTIDIYPGTYLENLSLAPHVYLRALRFYEGSSSFGTTVIRGNHTFNYDSASPGVFAVFIEGIALDATSGVCLTYAGTASKGVYLITSTIGSGSAASAVEFGGTGAANQLVLRESSAIGVSDTAARFWTVTTATGVYVSLSGKSYMRHLGRFAVAGEAVNLTTAQTLIIEEGEILGGITISAAAKVAFRQVAFSNPLVGAQSDHITITNAVTSDSFFERCTGGAAQTSGELRIGGAQANSLTETPSSNTGSVRRFSDDGANAKRWISVRNNYSASTNPTVSDDISQGYAVGSFWFRTDTMEWFLCDDASTGAAVWREVSVGGGGGVAVKTVDPTINDDQTLGYDPGSLWVNTANKTLWVCISAATGAAVWRNTTELAHTYPYLVGTTQLAPFQTIQAAINQAKLDGGSPSSPLDVWVLPGSYSENLTLEPGINVRAVVFPDHNAEQHIEPLTVTINGTMTLTNSLLNPPQGSFVYLSGLQVTAPSGSATLTIASTQSAFVVVAAMGCFFEATNADCISYSPGPAAVSCYPTLCYFRTTNGRIARIPVQATLIARTCRTLQSGSTRSVVLAGGVFRAQNDDPGFGESAGFSLPVEVETATSGSYMALTSVAFNIASGSDVIVDGTLLAGSYYFDCLNISTKKRITVGGANASQFIEAPVADAGDVKMYDGYRWQDAQLAAQKVSFLVGPSGTAKYTTIQSAIDAAVLAGCSNANPMDVNILDGTYTENLTLAPGIRLTAVNRLEAVRGGDPDPRVIIVGKVTYNYDDAGTTTHYIVLYGIKVAPTTGSAIEFTGTSRKGLNIRNCWISSVDSDLILPGPNRCYIEAYAAKLDASTLVTQKVIALGSNQTFSAFRSGVFGPFSGTAVTLDGTSPNFTYAASTGTDNEGISGKVNVLATATSAVLLLWGGFIAGTTPNIIIDGAVLSLSRFFQFYQAAGVRTPIVISGTNASTFKEDLSTDAGGVMIYNGSQWLAGQLSAQQTDYLVGPAGKAKYTSVQAAINQAVTDGHDKLNPTTVFILDGVYTENLTLSPGINLCSVNEPPDDTVICPVTITGNHTFATSLGSGQPVEFRGIKFTASGTSPAFAVSGTDTHSLTFYSCRVESTSTANLFTATGGAFSLSATRSFFNSSAAPICTLRSGDDCRLTKVAAFAITTDLFDLEGGTLYVFNGPNETSLQFYGRIHIVTSYTSTLLMESVQWGSAGPHVQCDGSASATSWWKNCYSIDQDTKMVVAGANANTFAEHPTTYDGGIWRYRNDGSAAPEWKRVRNNFSATVDPAVGNDSSQGYAVGSWWYRTDTQEWFLCYDSSVGAAVWKEVASGGGGGTYIRTVDPTVNDDITLGYDIGELWLNTVTRVLWCADVVTTGAAKWRRVTNLSDHDYLVGPVGSARFQTIQSAINQAVTDGHGNSNPADVWILAGTYVEDISMTPGIYLRAVSSLMRLSGHNAAEVKIDGTVTCAMTDAGATIYQFRIYEIDINPTAGSSKPAITESGTARKNIRLSKCQIRANDADVFSLGGSSPNVTVEVDNSVVVSTGAGFTTAVIPANYSIFCNGSQASTLWFNSAARVIKLDGGTFGFYGTPGQNGGLFGTVEVLSTGSGSRLYLNDIEQWNPTTGVSSHLIVGASISSLSFFYHCTGVNGAPIVVSGSNANEFVELPKSTNDGTIWRYRDDGANSKQWALVRNNFVAIVDPAVGNDNTQGYAVGSIWLNTSTNEWYICRDASTGAAIWRELTTGTGGTTVKSSDPTVGDDQTQGYDVGDFWLNSTTEKLWQALDVSTGAAIWWPVVQLQTQVIYVAKSGDDTYDGKSPERPKLTIAAAITSAGTPASEAVAVTVAVLDDGEYDEDLSHVQYVNVHAPHATLKGSQTLSSDMKLIARRLINDGAQNIVVKSGAGRSFVEVDQIIGTGALDAVSQSAGTLHLKARTISNSADDLVVVTTASTALHLDVDSMVIPLNQTGISSTGATVDGQIRDIVGAPGTTAILLSTSAKAVLLAGSIGAATSYNVDGTSTLRLIVASLAGTETIASGADVHVTRAGGLDRIQTIYVAKSGNDNLDGLTPDKPKLTIGAAITAAGSPAGESSAVTIEVIDNGTYAEDISTPSWVNINAPRAAINTTTNTGHIIRDDCRWVIGSITAIRYAVQMPNSETGVSTLKIGRVTRPTDTTNQMVMCFGGTLKVDIDYVGGVGGAVCAQADSAASPRVVAKVGRVEANGASTGFTCNASGSGAPTMELELGAYSNPHASAGTCIGVGPFSATTCRFRGRFGSIVAPNAKGISALAPFGGTAKVDVSGEYMQVSVPVETLHTSCEVNLWCNKIDGGTNSILDGSQVRINQSRRDNLASTVDPAVSDDSNDGYSVGSWWYRTDTKEWFICCDATAGAAIWKEVGAGGGGTTHVDTVDPTINDDQTLGYDVGEFWLNTVDRDLFVCLSSAVGAAVWLLVPSGRKIRLQTTDASVTVAAAITLADPETSLIDVYITARRTDSGTDHAAYQRKAAVYRNGGGATLIGTVDTPLTRETDTNWDASIAVSGNDLQITVQGATGQTVEWRVTYKIERM